MFDVVWLVTAKDAVVGASGNVVVFVASPVAGEETVAVNVAAAAADAGSAATESPAATSANVTSPMPNLRARCVDVAVTGSPSGTELTAPPGTRSEQRRRHSASAQPQCASVNERMLFVV